MGGSSAYNYHGLAVFPGREDELPAMVQVYRSGAVTAFRTARLLIDNRPLIPSTVIGDFLIEAGGKLLEFVRELGLAGPAVIDSALLRLSGYSFAIADRYGFDTQVESRRQQIVMPQIWIEDLADNSVKIDEAMRPALDVLWQTHGLAECPFFDPQGRWTPPR